MTAVAVPLPSAARAGARLEVDLGTIAANVRIFVARVPALMAVVKADGFGHGAVDVARTALANGATWLGVTSIDEALALRSAGLVAPLLSWLNPVATDWATAIDRRVALALPTPEHAAAVRRAAAQVAKPALVHLHLDCGMAREGASADDWPRLCRSAAEAESAGLFRVEGLMGHLPCADQPGHPADAEGRRRFAWGVDVARASGLSPAVRHLAATAAALDDPLSHHTLCRVGAGLVGIDPTGRAGLQPALTLIAPVVAVRDVPAGTAVGYGHTWLAPRATRLATLPLGYADGLQRGASGRAAVTLRGRRVPIVGRISMDQIVVDAGDLPVSLGDEAVVWGAGGPSTAEWAGWCDTVEHEIVTGVGRRVARVVRRATGEPLVSAA